MPTLEYKIRKLAEILEEQGVYLDDFTLSEEAWQTWLDEHNAIEPSGAFFIECNGRKIRMNRRGGNVLSRSFFQGVPNVPGHRNAPGQPPIPMPAIVPPVPLTPPWYHQGGDGGAIEEQQRLSRLIEKHRLGTLTDANTNAVGQLSKAD